MKKIGIIGGLGPESTLEYYSKIIDAFKDKYEENGYPEIVLESVNLKEFLQLATDNKWDEVADKLSARANNLKHNGASFGAIASNTPHYAFNKITEKTDLPLISIVEETAMYIETQGLKKVLLLGTKFTMSTSFYPDMLREYHIESIVPETADQDFIHDKIFTELEFGIVKPETKQAFIAIIEKLNKEHHVDGVVMACTELPLILKTEDISQEYVDPTIIHIEAIVKKCAE